jgi:mono/diheme cytochrome c family protein
LPSRILIASTIIAIAVSTAARAQDLVAEGAATFENFCARCHGDQLSGGEGTYDLRKLRAEERPRFTNSVTNGKNAMPPWRGVLKDADLDALWAYIRANAYP